MVLLKEIIQDTTLDCLKMVPFLLAAFLLIEALEHYGSGAAKQVLGRVGKAAPAVGALAGCVPQCGFSVMAANLYAGGIISAGTLIAVFIATSDEAILIIMGNPGRGREVLYLLGVKLIIAIVAGYYTDIFLSRHITVPKQSGNICHDCGCSNSGGIVKPAVRHTIKIVIYLFLFTGVLNIAIAVVGMEKLSAVLLGNSIFQPVIAALIGLIPNCASSVVLTQLYLRGAISFASVIAGLCSGAGIGMVVLFKMNSNRKENVKLLVTLFVISSVVGIVMKAVGY